MLTFSSTLRRLVTCARYFRAATHVTGALMLMMALACLPAGAETRSDARTLTVFAAASLKNALEEAARAFEAKSGIKVIISFAASSQLARQIEAGAPADLFISADTQWMDVLEKAGAIAPATRADLLGNELVLVVATPPQPAFEKITPPAIEQKMIQGTFALAEVTSVPAGRYAKAALTHLGQWDKVKSRVVMADNVRAALALVARGETDFGIVYASDAKIEPGVFVVQTFPPQSHPPIVYPMALTQTAAAGARTLAAFLASPQAQDIFRKYGFTAPPERAK